MNNLSIRLKLLICFILIAVLMTPINIYTIISVNHIKKKFSELVDKDLPRIQALLQIKIQSTEVSNLINDLNADVNQSNEAITDKKNQLLAALMNLNNYHQRYQNLLPAEHSTETQFALLNDKVMASALHVFTVIQSNANKNVIQQGIKALVQNYNNLNFAIDTALFDENQGLEEVKKNNLVTTQQIYQYILVANIIIILISILLSLLLSNFIALPIIKLRDFAKSTHHENVDHRITVTSRDEIGQLAESINQMLEKIATTKSNLIEASMQAGKAEIATNILHSVGNLLNSINTSVNTLQNEMNQSFFSKLEHAIDLLNRNKHNISEYLSTEKGPLMVDYLMEINSMLQATRNEQLIEVERLAKNLQDINNIVQLQQEYVRKNRVVEKINIAALIDDAIQLNRTAIKTHNIDITIKIPDELDVVSEKSKVQQILVNIIKNAVEALIEKNNPNKLINITVKNLGNRVSIAIEDNGMGLSAKTSEKLFTFGFTTKISGHGYGLHHSFLLAKELGGLLTAQNVVSGGALFIIEIPLKPIKKHNQTVDDTTLVTQD